MPSRVTVTLTDGRAFTRALADYPGFRTRPQTWEDAVAKFTMLAEQRTTDSARADIVAAVRDLDHISVVELTHLLRCLVRPTRRAARQPA